MKFEGRVTKVVKSAFIKDGEKNKFYTVCLQEESEDKQFLDSIAINFFGDKATQFVDSTNLKEGDYVTAFYGSNYKIKKVNKTDNNGDTSEVEYITNSLNGWRVDLHTAPTSQSVPEDLPF